MAKQNESARQLPGWIVDHMRKYVETDGQDGHIWNGVPTLLLTTTGRRSKQPLMLPLIYGRDGDRYVIVASKGGDPNHPAWYLNLVAHPQVKLQVGADKFNAKARDATAKNVPLCGSRWRRSGRLTTTIRRRRSGRFRSWCWSAPESIR